MQILDNPLTRFYGMVLIIGIIVSLITILICRKAGKRFIKYVFPATILVFAGALYAVSLFANESMRDLALAVMSWLVFLEGIIGVVTAIIYDFFFKTRKYR